MQKSVKGRIAKLWLKFTYKLEISTYSRNYILHMINSKRVITCKVINVDIYSNICLFMYSLQYIMTHTYPKL